MALADTLQLLYEGSVKRVFASQSQPDSLFFQFTNDYSVFDWGKMPDTIENKGRALAVMGAFFFEQLRRQEFWQALPGNTNLKSFDADWLAKRWQHSTFNKLKNHGAPTHFRSLRIGDTKLETLDGANLLAEPILMEVTKAAVVRPEAHQMISNQVYFYDNQALPSKRLVPLEIVFRFGMPSGSSLIERLEKDPSYARQLSLKEVPQPDRMFPHPVLEFFTKLEPKDRLLSVQEAALMSALSPQLFEELTEFSLDIALALYAIFGDRGIELWDGKIELILADGVLMLADSIGPDELRLIFHGDQLSKEMIRQVYRGTVWEKALKEAQAKARIDSTRDWKQVCIEDLAATPENLSEGVKMVVDRLYGTLTNHVLAREIFPDHPNLEDYIKLLPSHMVCRPVVVESH